MPTATLTKTKKEEATEARLSPLKRALISRVGAIVRDLDDAELEQAASSVGSKTVLYRILTSPESIAEIEREDPLAQAKLRGREIAAKLLAMEGGTIGLEEVAKQLGMTRQGVLRRRKKNQLFAVDVGKKGARYPMWQFAPNGGTLPGLEKVLAVLHTQGRFGWGVYSFFLSRHCDINGEVPLTVLREGRIDEVVRAAEMEGEMGK
jgi:hypothetical protein